MTEEEVKVLNTKNENIEKEYYVSIAFMIIAVMLLSAGFYENSRVLFMVGGIMLSMLCYAMILKTRASEEKANKLIKQCIGVVNMMMKEFIGDEKDEK